ncbi:hypothetical protein JW752_00980 [Candidatus Peregrinibacteria bacterium]|nr:hypothetical protein [Candidatus Peregrinibacteria bacterium]
MDEKDIDNSLRLFLVESPNAMDLLQGRSESAAIEKICKLFGHEVASMIVRSKEELKTALEYVANIDEAHDENEREDVPLCVHLGAHGDKIGLEFGKDVVTWKELFGLLEPLCEAMPAYNGKVVLVLSACNAAGQKLTAYIAKNYQDYEGVKPPAYLFATEDEAVHWDDALVSWTIFYHKLPTLDLNEAKEVQRMINIIRAVAAKIVYWRWDDEKQVYRKYSGRTPKPLSQKPREEDRS